MQMLKSIFLITLLSFSFQALSEPWIDASDLYLKANIQLLADTGHIKTPVTTYPLMWSDIDRDLQNINSYALSDIEKNAYFHIKYQLKLAKNNNIILRASTASKGSKFTSFGDKNRYQHSVQAQLSYMTDSFAVKLAPGAAYTQDGKNEFIADGSYVAGFIGNWVISLGKQDRWYGPMWDSSFTLTNNAQPLPAVTLSRKSAIPVRIPFTEYEMPWTVTTFMGHMDDTRQVNNTLLWGFRLNFKPLPNLELGINRLAQWGGDGNPKGLDVFWNILIGKTNCGAGGLVCDENNPNPANQQAGFDWRYSFSLMQTPISFYGNYLGEDGDNHNTFGFVTKAQKQFGFDTHVNISGVPTTAYIEYGDSLGDCGVRDGIGNCMYEHSLYQTGLRYRGRTISNLYDNDSETFVLGAITQFNNDIKATTKLRYLNLNYDNSDKAPDNPIIGNPLTAVHQKMYMLSTSVEKSHKQWRFTVGGDVSNTKTINTNSTKSDINVFLDVEYIL